VKEPVAEHDLDALPAVLTVEQVRAVLRISRGTAYELVHSRGFPNIQIGRSIRVPKAAFIKWMAEQAADSQESQ
jgi:excisionase family DNA binding protein